MKNLSCCPENNTAKHFEQNKHELEILSDLFQGEREHANTLQKEIIALQQKINNLKTSILQLDKYRNHVKKNINKITYHDIKKHKTTIGFPFSWVFDRIYKQGAMHALTEVCAIVGTKTPSL